MKKMLLIMVAVLLGVLDFQSQAQVVTIGTGTASNGTTAYPAPYGNYFFGARNQQMYTAAELSAAGILPGATIDSLGFNVTGVNGTALTNFEIQLGGTSDAALTNTWVAGMTSVFGPVSYLPVAGVNMHVLSSTYVWDGCENLVVETCFNNTGWTNNDQVQWTTGLPGNYSHTYRADAAGVCANTATTQLSTSRSNLTIGYTNPTGCIQPISLTSSGVTATSATLGWTDLNGTPAASYSIELIVAGATPTGVATHTGLTNPATLTGLVPGTNYEFYVRAVCSASDSSGWSCSDTFSTPPTCIAPSALTATNITPGSADLGWTENNAATLWEIEIGLQGFPPAGTATIPSVAVTNPYTLAGLPQNTCFDYYVRSICGAGDTSSWTGPFTFCTTLGCDSVRTITISSITDVSAQVAWVDSNSPPASGGYEIEWVPAGTAPTGTGTPVAASPYTITGLTTLTGYDVYVRALCGGTAGNSPWNGPVSFTTTIAPMSCAGTTSQQDLLFEGFDAALPGAADCWTTSGSGPSWSWDNNQTGSGSTGPDGGVTSPGYAYLETSTAAGTDTLILPNIDLSNATDARLLFNWHMYGAAMGTLQVEVFDGATQAIVWDSTGQTQTTQTDPWELANVSLSAYIGKTVTIKFVGIRGTSFTSDMAIDDVTVQACVPTCPTPSALMSSAITTTTATLAWTENGTATSWDVTVVPAGTDPNAAAATNPAVTTNPLSLTGLMPATSYDYYVRAICGADKSAWGESCPIGNFVTPPACDSPGTVAITNINPVSATISWVDSNMPAASLWEVEIVAAGSAPTGAGVFTTASPYAATSLTANTCYDVYLRTACDSANNDYSPWNGPFTFCTPCAVFAPPVCEDFSVGAPTPACWTQADDGDATTGPLAIGTGAWYADNFNNVAGDPSPGINIWLAAKRDWIISPDYDLATPGGPYQMEMDFDIVGFGGSTPSALGSDDSVQVLVSNDAGATWTVLQTWDATTPLTSAGGDRIIHDLSAYTGDTVRLAVWASEGVIDDAPDNEVHFDDFCVVPIPSCYEPYALSASNVTGTSADISWTDSNMAATTWEIEVVGGGVAPTGAGVITTTNPYALTGLSPDSCYDVYLRTVCGMGDSSLWAGPFNFCTPCVAATVAQFCTDGNFTGGVPSCWTNAGGDASNWRTGAPGYAMSGTLDHTGGVTANADFLWVDGSGGATNSTLTSVPVANADIVAMTNPMLQFYVKSHSTQASAADNATTDYNEFWGRISYDGGTTYTDVVFINSELGTDWNLFQVEIDKTALGTNDIYFQFEISESATSTAAFYNDIALDDVCIVDSTCAGQFTAISTVNGNSDCECTDLMGWTHYGDQTSQELNLSVQKGAYNDPNISPYIVNVQGAAMGASGNLGTLGAGAPYVSAQHWYVFNRFWDVDVDINDAARQPSAATDVRFYYFDADYTALQSTVATAGFGSAITAHTDMLGWKVANDKDPNPANNHATVLTADFTSYTNGAVSPTTWAHTADPLGMTSNQLEYQVTSFSGGGGGFGSGSTNGPLPITLTDFTVTKEGSVSLAAWVTANEDNNSHFNLQRSLDGNDFATLGKVNSKAVNGTSTVDLSYTFTDESPQIGHNYYRLEQVDLDGQKSYSEVVDLVWGADGSVVAIYPNPATSRLNVDVSIDKVSQLEVRLVDMSGRVVKSVMQKTQKGMNNVTFDLSDIATGVYGVQIYDNNSLIHSTKVNKTDK